MAGAHRFVVLTLHPEMVEGPLSASILGRARRQGLIGIEVVNLRDSAEGRHRQVDDTPYGGGAGMVIKVDVVARALRAVSRPQSRIIHLSPAGRPMDQATAERLAAEPDLIFLCGHYEGIDARVQHLVHEELSLGDFVLTGGEIAACAIIDATARLLPGVLGNATSAQEESFSEGLLEHGQYTRPRIWEDHAVPEILLSGDHGRIASFRHQEAVDRTRRLRPDLYRAWLDRQDPKALAPASPRTSAPGSASGQASVDGQEDEG